MEKKRNYDFEFLTDFDVNSIDVATREGRWAVTLLDWLNSDTKACKFSLKSADERRRCRGALANYIRSHNLDWTVYLERNTYNIYVVRA